ncbi:hypothetical protein ACFV3R_14780 [Streptomyces sp. NPDC059740]|uniref:hypothetical protein n=1 Tax=Streptomyces sp. NPDC059740 TaxID=3346926 RepID=UPI00364C8D9E
MGAGGFQANTESLKAEGENFVKLGEDFYQSVTRLMNGLSKLNAGPPADGSSRPQQPQQSFGQQMWTGLTSFGGSPDEPPWGGDDIGEKFGVAYEGVRDGMYESMGHLSAKLQEIGKALSTMAKNHDENEDFNDALIKQHVDNQQAWQDPTAQQGTFTTAPDRVARA